MKNKYSNNITIIILTKNEEKNIEGCIQSLQNISKRIVVVDSYSTDKTIELATKNGAEVFQHEFVSHGEQFNWALDNVSIKTKWVLRIDADEIIPKELADEIIEKCKIHENDEISAYIMKFKVYFLGRFLKHGGAYPFKKINLFKYKIGRFDERPMHDNVIIQKGIIDILENDALHYDQKDISAYVSKHNWYSSLEADDYINNKKMNDQNIGNRAKIRGLLRDKVYYRLPSFFRAKLYYWFIYLIKGAFLDGRPGKIYAMIQSYIYRFLVDAKIYEYKINKDGDNDESFSN